MLTASCCCATLANTWETEDVNFSWITIWIMSIVNDCSYFYAFLASLTVCLSDSLDVTICLPSLIPLWCGMVLLTWSPNTRILLAKTWGYMHMLHTHLENKAWSCYHIFPATWKYPFHETWCLISTQQSIALMRRLIERHLLLFVHKFLMLIDSKIIFCFGWQNRFVNLQIL